jgi:hypothetical protein
MWWRREKVAVFGKGNPAVRTVALLANDWVIEALITGRKLEISIQGGRDTDW